MILWALHTKAFSISFLENKIRLSHLVTMCHYVSLCVTCLPCLLMCFPLLSNVSWSVPTTASPNAFQRRGPRGLVSIPLPSWSIARNTSILGRDPNSVVSLFAQLFLRRTQRLPNHTRGRKHSETQSARSAFNEDGFLNDKEWLYGLNLVFSASVTSSRSVVKFWSKKDPLRVSSLHCTAAGGALKGLLSPPLQLNTLRLYK